MANTVLTPTVIANELLMRFRNNLSFAAGASHEYDERFDKIGDTFNLRVPVRFVANDGHDITSQIQDVTETSVPLVINERKNVAFQFTSKDLTLSIDRFADRYLNSAAVSLANAFEVSGLTLAYQKTPNWAGTAGETLATSGTTKILAAGAKLDNNSCPMDGDRHLVVNPSAQAAAVDALKGLFQSSTEVGKQYKSGRMGQAFGFDWAMSQNVRTHTMGQVAGTVLTNGASQTGSTIAIDGLTAASAVIKKGDKFTIADVYAVNPVSGDTLDYLQQFTVTADTTASTNAIAALPISPSIVTSGPTKTVSAAAGDNKAITWMGSSATGYPMNLAYHRHAFTYATVPLEMPKGVHFASRATDKDSGISIRIVSDYKIDTDVFVTRCDIAYGWAARRPEWSCVLIG